MAKGSGFTDTRKVALLYCLQYGKPKKYEKRGQGNQPISPAHTKFEENAREQSGLGTSRMNPDFAKRAEERRSLAQLHGW